MKKKIISLCIGVITLFSCEEVFYEADISKDMVEITAPTDNVEVTAGSIKLNWKAIDGANTYKIQIATPSFDNATQIVLDSTTTEITITKDLAEQDYQWRVKAQNSAYETAYTTYNLKVKE
jgi:hypothetical protein